MVLHIHMLMPDKQATSYSDLVRPLSHLAAVLALQDLGRRSAGRLPRARVPLLVRAVLVRRVHPTVLAPDLVLERLPLLPEARRDRLLGRVHSSQSLAHLAQPSALAVRRIALPGPQRLEPGDDLFRLFALPVRTGPVVLVVIRQGVRKRDVPGDAVGVLVTALFTA